MEKVTKHYVQRLYKGFVFNETREEEILSRDSHSFEDDERSQGFRFYDQDYIIDGEDVYKGEEYNFSNWVFYGIRMDLEQIKRLYGGQKEYQILIGNMENNNYNFVCLTRGNQFLPMNDGDMTFDEYIEQDKLSL